MLTVPAFLAVLAFVLACLGGAAVVVGWLVAEILEHRDALRADRASAESARVRDQFSGRYCPPESSRT